MACCADNGRGLPSVGCAAGAGELAAAAVPGIAPGDCAGVSWLAVEDVEALPADAEAPAVEAEAEAALVVAGAVLAAEGP
ncbi:MAG TPA: hypothetical protein VK272_10955 [Solirubrobacteraceae bacterium]|nr:hypothetical protein [Solirubrobacteraceae bacterium]